MAANKRAEEPEEESSRAAGGCVLIVLVGVVTAVVFAVSATAGVLCVWVVGAVLLWHSARRMSDSSATPPPRGVAPRGDVSAVETGEIARVVRIAEGVACIIHPVRKEVAETPETG